MSQPAKELQLALATGARLHAEYGRGGLRALVTSMRCVQSLSDSTSLSRGATCCVAATIASNAGRRLAKPLKRKRRSPLS